MNKHIKSYLSFMFSGFSLEIWITEGDCPDFEINNFVHYFIMGNKKILKIKRFNDKEWETIVSPDLILNPIDISKEEEFLISILPGVTDFDLSLLRISEKINQMWTNGESETSAKEFLLNNLLNNTWG